MHVVITYHTNAQSYRPAIWDLDSKGDIGAFAIANFEGVEDYADLAEYRDNNREVRSIRFVTLNFSHTEMFDKVETPDG